MSKLKRFIELLKKPEMSILPAHLAFFLILSLFPLFSMIGVVISILPITTDEIIYALNSLPVDIANILLPFLTESASTFNIIFIIFGLYVSSNASSALIVASNSVYKIENKSYIHRKVKSIFMTFWLILLLLFTLIILAFGTFIIESLMNFGILENLTMHNYIIITVYKYLIGFAFIFFTIKILFTIAPDEIVKSRHVNIGALFTTLGIILVTTVYSFYISNFARYDILYGNLANIVALMLLVYFISYTFILGISLNSSYYNE